MDRSDYLAAIKEFTLMDDIFMSTVLDGDTETVGFILRIILDKEDLVVTEVIAQRSYNNLLDRSVRLDIFAEDSTGKAYNIEVQRSREGANVRRARYNSSMIDTRLLNKGDKFSELADSYVIFITENDIFGNDLPLYEIERIIKQTNAYFGDGSHIIYVNGAYQDDSPLGKLIHDFKCKDAGSMNYPQIAERVRFIKEDEGGFGDMCDIMEELNRRAVAEAEERTEIRVKREQKRAIAMAMLRNGKLSYDEISLCTGLSLSEVEELAEKMNETEKLCV